MNTWLLFFYVGWFLLFFLFVGLFGIAMGVSLSI